MTIQIDERKNYRQIFDDMNPRIYQEQWKCANCGKWIDAEEVVWIDPETGDATTSEMGKPFHVDCAPEQP